MSYLKDFSTTKKLGVMVKILYHLEEVGRDSVPNMKKN